MSLEDRKQSYLQRMAGMAILFAILGSVVLCIAISYINKVISDALPSDPQSQSQAK
ncbi:MAG: hypothetical protein IPM23_11105 [Candidatus Melainabacteria bacterium]|nr:hypothetical protein [Candidatus Melainabacteria bacterium]